MYTFFFKDKVQTPNTRENQPSSSSLQAVCSDLHVRKLLAGPSGLLTMSLTKRNMLEDAVWNDSVEVGQGGTLSFQNKMKLHISDQATWIQWKGAPEKYIPHCILQYLHRKDEEDMELKLPEERYIAGESVIVEDIATDGACILLTKNTQAELAFAVTRINVVAFRQTDYIFQGQPYAYTQYCYDLPKNYMENLVYPFVPQIPPGNSRSVGEMVAYNPKLQLRVLQQDCS